MSSKPEGFNTYLLIRAMSLIFAQHRSSNKQQGNELPMTIIELRMTHFSVPGLVGR